MELPDLESGPNPTLVENLELRRIHQKTNTPKKRLQRQEMGTREGYSLPGFSMSTRTGRGTKSENLNTASIKAGSEGKQALWRETAEEIRKKTERPQLRLSGQNKKKRERESAILRGTP